MPRQTHKLKTLTHHFIDVVAGEKRAEVRKNDRNFKNGDFIILQEFDGECLTGNEHQVMITNIITGGQYGIINGFAVLSIMDVN